jgi:large subunit ribosomal protein LP0
MSSPVPLTATGNPVSQRKLNYEKTLLKCLADFKQILLINVDNVGSAAMQNLRKQLRGRAQILMGKNTVIRKILRTEAKVSEGLLNLLPVIKMNVGFVFTNEPLLEIRAIISERQDPAAAKPGIIAPCDVWLEPGPTNLDPGQTAFFQAMNIGTKINRGSIEISGRTQIIFEGEKVSASAAALLSKLKKMPFFYGIKVNHVYESGSCYPAKVLDLSDADIEAKFLGGLAHAGSVSLGLGYPSAASIPHLLFHAVRKVIAFSVETEYDLEVAAKYKEFLANPDAFAVAAAPTAGGAAVEEKKEVEEEESSGGGMSDLSM